MENEVKALKRNLTTQENTKVFKYPSKWKRQFAKGKKKGMEDLMLVWFLNKKNQIEQPKFMPIFDGNMIVYKNKPYEFDPRAVWTIQGVKGNPQGYLIKEIDRRPVMNKHNKVIYKDAAISNMDIDEVRARGDSTESDEFLIKAALKAQTAKVKKPISKAVLIVIGLVVVGGLIFLLSS